MRIRASFALLLTLTGCTTTHRIPKTELTRLDGWKGEETTMLQDIGSALRNERKDIRSLRDTSGDEHRFTADTPLVLVPHQGDEIVEKYVEVHADEQRFQGVPRAAFRGNVELPMDQISHAGVRKFSPGKTVLLVVGGGGSLMLTLIVLSLVVSDGSGDSDGDVFD
ncbi:MAG TPA: hypothetical protein VK539_15820 [Myxococcaceae bacterium]|nr:hypothetical protein [Myxococcaceae bacterium]